MIEINLEQNFNYDVIEIFKQWKDAVQSKHLSKDEKKSLYDTFSNFGFTKIVVHNNGTVDGRKGKNRYLGMYISSTSSLIENNDIVCQNVILNYEDKK